MGDGIKPSCPGSVVTWEAHFQNQISVFCYSFSPSSKRTLKKLPTRSQHIRKNNHRLGPNEWKVHHSRRNNNREEKRKEREEVTEIKTAQEHVIWRRKWEQATLEVWLNWMNWRQRSVKRSHYPSTGFIMSLQTSLSKSSLCYFTITHLLIRSLIHSTITCGIFGALGLVPRR